MIFTVQFDSKHFVKTNKVDYEVLNDMLSSEFMSYVFSF